MGSRRFCEDYCGNIRFAAVIISDLIGHDAIACELPIPAAVKALAPHLRKLVAVMGAESNGTFPGIVEAATKDAKDLRVLTTLHDYVGPLSDHAAFAKAGQPFLFLSCGQGSHYHTPQDTMEWINFGKLAHITRFVGDIIERIDLTASDADTAPCDPVKTETRMLRKAFGPALRLILRFAGITLPKSRVEMDAFIRTLMKGSLR